MKQPGAECTFLPVDGMRVEIQTGDGRRINLHAVSDVTVGSWWSHSGLTVVSNTGHVGRLNLMPRAHPNDGRLDVLELHRTMRLRERMTARRRAVTGTHLPHPELSVRAVTDWNHERHGRQTLRVDGVLVRDWTRVGVRVEPDRWLVVV